MLSGEGGDTSRLQVHGVLQLVGSPGGACVVRSKGKWCRWLLGCTHQLELLVSKSDNQRTQDRRAVIRQLVRVARTIIINELERETAATCARQNAANQLAALLGFNRSS